MSSESDSEGHIPPGQDGVKSLLCPFAFVGFGAGLEAKDVVSGFQDVTVVGQPIEQRGGHLGIAEHAGHLPKAGLVVTVTEARS